MTTAPIADIGAGLALPMTDAQVDKLERYLALLQRWNATHNLSAVRESSQMRSQHLADCLAILPALARERAGPQVTDVGSGGGLPGVVMAIMRPDLEVKCVDAVGKKAAFIRQAAGVLALPNLQALHARVESLPPASADLVVCRAFASLADFVALTRPLLKPGAVWLAMKGQHPAAEIGALPANVDVFHVERLNVPTLAAERCLVWMRPIRT